MKKVILLFSFLFFFVSSTNLVAATGWFSDYVLLNVNGTGSNYYWIGSDPGFGTQLSGANFGTISTLVITGCDMKYWSNTQDRAGGAFYYKIMASDNTTQVIAPVEIIWTQSGPVGNDYQGLKSTTINIHELSGLDINTTYKLHIYAKSWGTDGDSWLSNSGSNYVATFTTSGTWPVELTNFTAMMKGNNITLNWKTATEVNNYGFEVQKSSDNSSWNKIGFVNGAGNSNSPKEYTYTDKLSNINGKFYYRLKQIDNDGTISFSKVVEVLNSKPSTLNLSQNYPNPFNPSTVIKYQIPVDARVSIKVYNVLGNVVATLQNGFQTAGEYSVSVDGSNLASGVYFYKIEAGDFSATKKMLLTK